MTFAIYDCSLCGLRFFKEHISYVSDRLLHHKE